jgi:hypothetical protein
MMLEEKTKRNESPFEGERKRNAKFSAATRKKTFHFSLFSLLAQTSLGGLRRGEKIISRPPQF